MSVGRTGIPLTMDLMIKMEELWLFQIQELGIIWFTIKTLIVVDANVVVAVKDANVVVAAEDANVVVAAKDANAAISRKPADQHVLPLLKLHLNCSLFFFFFA